MNKGTAIVGFLLCFLAGMGLMNAIDRSDGVTMGAEPASAAGEGAHKGSPIPITKDDAQWGNPAAPVSIVEISDFECPFCSRVNPTIKKIKEEYGPEKVHFTWKHNPLPFHRNAKPAAVAAQTVFKLGGNDAFWKFHDNAFANQKALNEENFEKWASAAGVDVAKFKEEFKANKYAAKVDKDIALARSIGATGTPAFRINGVTLSGAQPFDKFKAEIDKQLKEAEKLIGQGTKKSEVSLVLTKQNFKEPEKKPDNKRRERKEDTTVWKVPVFKDDPVKGPADALVTIVEWSDFQCPFCSRVLPTLKKLQEEYKNDLRIVWKDNALPFHNRAKPAAAVARAAFEKGGSALFFKAHDALFENQKQLDDAGLEKISNDLGLSWPTVKAAIDSEKYADKIGSSMELASDLNARGTPHFFVNGRRLSGAQPFDNFKKLVDERLAEAKALVAKGVPRAKVYDEIMKKAKGPEEPETREVDPPSKDSPVKGAANAKVVIQEFSDFQCPFCSRVNPTMKQIMDEYGSQVKVVWRHFPLSFHKDAPLAAEAAQEAYAQKGNDGFWAYHDKLFANQKALKRPDLEKYAQEIGLDMGKFKAALDSHKHKATVDRDMAVAKKVGVSGTPAFMINEYFLSGAQPYPQFEKRIKLALKGKK